MSKCDYSKYGGFCTQCGKRKSYLDLRSKGKYYKSCHKCRLKIKGIKMENKKYKVGQQIEFKEDFEIETFRGRKIEVKKGDKAVVTSRGFITYITGNARDIRQVIEGITVEGYDCVNISKMIFQRLINVYNLEEFIEYEEIESKEIIDEIEDVLREIL